MIALAGMIAADEDALICDFAETYHIYDWRGLPVHYAAVLACGLAPDSRIKMAISGARATQEQILLAAMIDRLSLLLWMNTADAVKGSNRPACLVSLLTGESSAVVSDVAGFDDGAAFEAERQRMIESVVKGNE